MKPTIPLPTVERVLFYLLLLLNLVPLWSVHYFLTGDGPWERNPFEHLGKDGGYFEGQPPIANLLDFSKKTDNATVDYVVTWCLDEKKFGDHPFVQSMEQQLSQGYDLVFTSKNGFAKAFKRKGL